MKRGCHVRIAIAGIIAMGLASAVAAGAWAVSLPEAASAGSTDNQIDGFRGFILPGVMPASPEEGAGSGSAIEPAACGARVAVPGGAFRTDAGPDRAEDTGVPGCRHPDDG